MRDAKIEIKKKNFVFCGTFLLIYTFFKLCDLTYPLKKNLQHTIHYLILIIIILTKTTHKGY